MPRLIDSDAQAQRPAASWAVGALGRMGWRTRSRCAVLFMLLRDHPIDRRDRCQSCRHPGAMVGPRWRCCRIYITASHWLLRQPDQAR
ncbi:MAG: hypothetical protein ACRDTJ_23260 [Pseudonocardiaceae bacterium]